MKDWINNFLSIIIGIIIGHHFSLLCINKIPFMN